MPVSLTFRANGRVITVIRVKPSYAELQVSSSKPGVAPYDVVVRADEIRCACRGNLYRHDCAHAKAVRAMLDKEGALTP